MNRNHKYIIYRVIHGVYLKTCTHTGPLGKKVNNNYTIIILERGELKYILVTISENNIDIFCSRGPTPPDLPVFVQTRWQLRQRNKAAHCVEAALVHFIQDNHTVLRQ